MLHSITAYPHPKGDDLTERAQALSNRAYEKAAQRLPGMIQQIEFTIPGGAPITNFLHMPKGDGPFLTVLICSGLDAMQTDYYSLYERCFTPRGIAMPTIDMPSVDFSSKWRLTQDFSLLHQHVLKALPNIPWADHIRVAAFGFRFGANVAVHLVYFESPRLKTAVCLGSVVYTLLSDLERQQQVLEMYLGVLVSYLGMHDASNEALRMELNRCSSKA